MTKSQIITNGWHATPKIKSRFRPLLEQKDKFLIRENTWWDRRLFFENHKDLEKFQQLVDLYQHWQADLEVTVGIKLTDTTNVSPLPLLKESKDFGHTLVTQYPDEELRALDLAIRARLSALVSKAFAQTEPSSPAYERMTSVFEQSSWRCGHRAFEKHWQNRLRAFASFAETDFYLRCQPLFQSFSKHSSPWLIKRVTSTEITFLLNSCPHTSPPSTGHQNFDQVHRQDVIQPKTQDEIHPEADRLCSFFSFWIRGFLYALRPNAYFTYQACEHSVRQANPQKRCQFTWSTMAIEPQRTV